MKWEALSDDVCPVARTLSVIGDRWTLLILRDCFLGLSRFDQFAQSTGVTRHILAARLKRLVAAGVLEKRPYSRGSKRCDYILTEMGRELTPALVTFRDWGKRNMHVRRASK